MQEILAHLYKHNKLSYFVVDEAHCVSQWGHNFNRDYFKLGELRDKYRDVPCVALTNTVPAQVERDIFHQLGLQTTTAHFKTSSFRSNLFYDVVFLDCLPDAEDDLISFVSDQLGRDWDTRPEVLIVAFSFIGLSLVMNFCNEERNTRMRHHLLPYSR